MNPPIIESKRLLASVIVAINNVFAPCLPEKVIEFFSFQKLIILNGIEEIIIQRNVITKMVAIVFKREKSYMLTDDNTN